MRLLGLVVVLLGLLSTAYGSPALFLGGDFSGLDGIYSPNFAVYDVASSSWDTSPTSPYVGNGIRDVDAVRGGLFVVGTFRTLGSEFEIQSQGVAFWDGNKWCGIRQAIGNGYGQAVWCDSNSSCWVTGSFSLISNVNLQTENNPNNFAHYIWSEQGNEWVFDTKILSWVNNGDPGWAGVIPMSGSLVVLPGSKYFFVGAGASIWRGSPYDNGFWMFLSSATLGAGVGLADWSIDLSGTPTLYGITTVAPQTPLSTFKVSSLTFSCSPVICLSGQPMLINFNVTGTEWVTLTVNAQYLAYLRVLAVNGMRYMVVQYDPDGLTGPNIARQQIASQTGNSAPAVLGQPFQQGPYDFSFGTAGPNALSLMPTGELLVTGNFGAGNLYYPSTNPATTDAGTGAASDIRSLDLLTGFAYWNSSASLWMQPFGGGFADIVNRWKGDIRFVYSNETNKYYFVGSEIDYVYNTRADKAAWFDSDSSLSEPFFPLFNRNLLFRGSGGTGSGAVYDIVCSDSSCSTVFVGGSFTFHGPNIYSSIVSVVVQRGGTPQITQLGGGLWTTATNLNDPLLDAATYQYSSGTVYTLAVNGGMLYAGGTFNRGGTNNVCLGNIAVIDTSNPNAAWQSLGAADSYVSDLKFYNGMLYAAGSFYRIGGVTLSYVGAYTYQSSSPQWLPLGMGVDNDAISLEVFQNRLIVAGDFQNAGGLPVGGIASWDGSKWRGLVPSCTNDCVDSTLGGDVYYNIPVLPNFVHYLAADPSGDFLWALGQYRFCYLYNPTTGDFSCDSWDYTLARWEYTNGDQGTWTAKGDAVYWDNSVTHPLAFVESDVLLVANNGDDYDYSYYYNPAVNAYNTGEDNWEPGYTIDYNVYVVRSGVGSASSLVSPLSVVLSYLF
jgi:hypothetical protein